MSILTVTFASGAAVIRNFPLLCFLRILVISTIALCLAACSAGAPRSVSLEEAKQITSNLESASNIELPPRSISDLLIILDRLKTTPGPNVESLRERADKSIDMKVAEETRAQLLIHRAGPAQALGRYEQAFQDAKQSLVLSPRFARYAHAVLASGYDELGDQTRALRHARMYALTAGDHAVIPHAFLAMMLATVGDFEGATEALEVSKVRAQRTYQWRGDGRRWGPVLRAFVPLAEGTVAYFQGDFIEAEKQFRESLRLVEIDMKNGGANIVGGTGVTLPEIRWLWKTYTLSWLARTLKHQGRLTEAELTARDGVVQRAEQFGLNSGEIAEALSSLATILSEQGRFDDATRIANRAVAVYDRMGADPGSVTRALVRQSLLDAHIGEELWQEATEIFDSIVIDLDSDPNGLQRLLRNNPTWALALIRTNRIDEAAERLQSLSVEMGKLLGERRYETAEIKGLLAVALSARGDINEAQSLFARAIPILLASSGRAVTDESNATIRQLRLQFVLEGYIDLLAERALTGEPGPEGINPAAEAFRIADAARGGVVQRALNSSAARFAVRDEELRELARREQDATMQIAALNSLRLQSIGNTHRKALASRVQALEAAQSAILRELEDRFPDYLNLVNPQPGSIAEVRENLEPNEAFIAFYVSTHRTYIWAVPARGETVFASTDIGRREMQSIVYRLRSALAPDAVNLGEIPDFDLATAYDLFSRLLAPVESVWSPAEELIVVSHDALGYLPLSVLPTQPAVLMPRRPPLFSRYRDVPWLVNTHAIAVLPSAASLTTLRSLPRLDLFRNPLVAFGDPVFTMSELEAPASTSTETSLNPADAIRGIQLGLRSIPSTRGLDTARIAALPRLPDTAEEVEGIAYALGADPAMVFIGEKANEQRVKEMDLSGTRVVVFATHGLVPGDLDGLTQPALALSSPEVSGTEGDGLLTMTEILGLRLDADWVVLSACNTGSGTAAEAVSGLGRAFFYAGSRALLVSNWPVHSESAKDLTTDIFARQSSDPALGRAQALRRSMLAMIQSGGRSDSTGRNLYAYAHPLFWAPFTVVGAGEPRTP